MKRNAHKLSIDKFMLNFISLTVISFLISFIYPIFVLNKRYPKEGTTLAYQSLTKKHKSITIIQCT